MPAYRFRIVLGPEHQHRQFETTTGPHPGPKTAEAHVRWQYPGAESVEPLGEEPAADVVALPGAHPDELPPLPEFVEPVLDVEVSGFVETMTGPDGKLREYVRLVDHNAVIAGVLAHVRKNRNNEGPDDQRDNGPEAETCGGTGDGPAE